MTLSELDSILEKASVPEHSAAFMSAMSGGEPFLEGPYLFVAAEDWLLAMGYPLADEYRAGEFEKSLSCAQYIRRYKQADLKGEVDQLYGTSIEFPSRSEHEINRRDVVFLEQMRPHLENGRCAVFVGSAHMLNLRRLIAEAGFTIRRSR